MRDTKSISIHRRPHGLGIWVLAVAAACVTGQLRASEAAPAVLSEMERVADWQLTHPSKHPPTDWTVGAGDAGFMALAGISGNPKYRDAMVAAGESNQWKVGPRPFHADDYCVGQTYAELSLLYRDPKMLLPLQAHLDHIMAAQTQPVSLDFTAPNAGDRWSWCDSLFMGPPVWLRLYAATGNNACMDFAVTNWWRTADYLYDKQEHLFYRDSTYFNKREANGKKVFWSRGNGWVIAGLLRVLQYLPMNHPDRPRFELMFKDMAGKIATCQQGDGLWRASLLDPDSFPLKETSGSGFYTYALAWGVNQGILDQANYQPAIEKAWAALNACVNPDGKLTHVQPIGADPKSFDENSTEIYGVGAYLLAGSEIYRMAVLEKFTARLYEASEYVVRVTNPSSFRRDDERVELNDDSPFWKIPGSHAVMDGVSSRILPSQIYVPVPHVKDANGLEHGKLVFQTDLAPDETRQFYILNTNDLAAIPPPVTKTSVHSAPERHAEPLIISVDAK